MRTNQSNKKVNKVKTTNKMVKKQSVRKSAVKDFTVGYTNEVYKVIQVGRTFAMLTTQNQPVTKVAGVSKQTMKKALDEGKAIQGYVGKTGKLTYKMVEIDREIDEIWAAINAIKDTAYDREEQPNYVKIAIATLDLQLKALYVEYDKLVDKEATEIARSKRLQWALGVSTM